MSKILYLCFTLLFISTNTYGSDKVLNSVESHQVNARELSQESKLAPQINQFNLKKVITDKDKTHKLVTNLISIVDVESPESIENTLRSSTKNLFISSYFDKTPLLSEFVFRISKEPEALANFVMIFLQKNKLIVFGIIIISTMVLSHFMGEFKFKFKLLSFERIGYSVTRFSIVNSIRIGSFIALFQENISQLLNVYIDSVATVQHLYPTLHHLLSFIA